MTAPWRGWLLNLLRYRLLLLAKHRPATRLCHLTKTPRKMDTTQLRPIHGQRLDRRSTASLFLVRSLSRARASVEVANTVIFTVLRQLPSTHDCVGIARTGLLPLPRPVNARSSVLTRSHSSLSRARTRARRSLHPPQPSRRSFQLPIATWSFVVMTWTSWMPAAR